MQRLKAVQIISEGQLTDSAKLRLLEEKVDRLDSARSPLRPITKNRCSALRRNAPRISFTKARRPAMRFAAR